MPRTAATNVAWTRDTQKTEQSIHGQHVAGLPVNSNSITVHFVKNVVRGAVPDRIVEPKIVCCGNRLAYLCCLLSTWTLFSPYFALQDAGALAAVLLCIVRSDAWAHSLLCQGRAPPLRPLEGVPLPRCFISRVNSSLFFFSAFSVFPLRLLRLDTLLYFPLQQYQCRSLYTILSTWQSFCFAFYRFCLYLVIAYVSCFLVRTGTWLIDRALHTRARKSRKNRPKSKPVTLPSFLVASRLWECARRTKTLTRTGISLGCCRSSRNQWIERGRWP